MKWMDILIRLVNLMGPELKSAIRSALLEWETKAKQTSGPVDDIVCALLLAIIGRE